MSDAGIPEATPDVLRARVDQENALLQRRAVLAKYEPQLMDQIIAAMTEQQAPPARTTDSERTIGSAAFPIQPGGTKGLSRPQMDQMMRQFLTELDSGAY